MLSELSKQYDIEALVGDIYRTDKEIQGGLEAAVRAKNKHLESLRGLKKDDGGSDGAVRRSRKRHGERIDMHDIAGPLGLTRSTGNAGKPGKKEGSGSDSSSGEE